VALGRPEGFLDRQVRGWSERWNQAQTEPVDSMAPVIAWLAEHRPTSAATTIVHHDYKLDNVMFDPAEPGRLAAVLDWEMATIGDPLADLGLTLTYWTLPEARRLAGMDQTAGWWTREEMVARYVERTGFDIGRLPWYEVLGIFKLGVIVQQIYARYVRGQTQDTRFRDMGQLVAALAATAGERIR
jgi:aminoglycoside phosphotransferase (APT) family kinase protein